MKTNTTIITLIAATAIAGLLFAPRTKPTAEPVIAEVEVDTTPCQVLDFNELDPDNHEMDIMRLAYATAWVESRWNEAAVNGSCVGFLQISPIMVREANRLLGFDCFVDGDRWDEQASIAIYHVVMDYLNPTADIVKACKIWNGAGVSQQYIQKVTDKYNELVAEGWYYDMED